MLSFRYLFLAGMMALPSLSADRAGVCGYQSKSKLNSPKDGCVEAGCIADSPEESKNRAKEQKRRQESAPVVIETDFAPAPYEHWNEQSSYTQTVDPYEPWNEQFPYTQPICPCEPWNEQSSYTQTVDPYEPWNEQDPYMQSVDPYEPWNEQFPYTQPICPCEPWNEQSSYTQSVDPYEPWNEQAPYMETDDSYESWNEQFPYTQPVETYEPWNEQASDTQPVYIYEPIDDYEPVYSYQPDDYYVEDGEYVNDINNECMWMPCPEPQRSSHRKVLVAAKAGYFYPLDSSTRDIASGGVASSFEVNVEVMGNWYAWASAGYIRMEGSTIAGEDPVTLEIVPAGLGLKYIYTIRSTCLDFYFGAGILPTYLKTTNESPFLQSGRDFDFGGVVKGGLLFNFSSLTFLDLFVDYNILSVHGSDSSDSPASGARSNLNSLLIGGGLGLRF